MAAARHINPYRSAAQAQGQILSSPQKEENDMGKISERKKQLYTWYFNKMYEIAKGNGLELQLADTWAHSLQVWATACELLNQILSKNEIDIDVEFVEFACFVHDIGRMVTGSPASYTKCPNHGFSHGPIGAAIVREQDFLQGCPAFPEKYQSSDELQKALARICERHTGCVGMSKKNYPANHHLFSAPTEWDEIAGVEGIFVSTIEEKIVGIADFLTKAHKVCPSRAGNNNIFGGG